MTTYQILSWKTIPLGVRAQNDGEKVTEHLPDRFQVAVDAVATNSGMIDQESYLAGFEWSDPIEREGSVREVAEAVLDELIAEYTPQRVKTLRKELEAQLTSNTSSE